MLPLFGSFEAGASRLKAENQMSHKFFGEHGKRYAQCVVCKKVLKWGAESRTTAVYNRPFLHCGKPVLFIRDIVAREIVEGRKKGDRLKAIVARRRG